MLYLYINNANRKHKMKSKLVIKHIPTMKRFRIEKHYIDETGFVFREDKYTWLEFKSLNEAEVELSKMLEAAE